MTTGACVCGAVVGGGLVGGGALVVGGTVGAAVVEATVVGGVVPTGTDVEDPTASWDDGFSVVVVPDALTRRWADVDDFGLTAPPIIMITKPDAVTIAPSLRVVILANLSCPRTAPTKPKPNTIRPMKMMNPPMIWPQSRAVTSAPPPFNRPCGRIAKPTWMIYSSSSDSPGRRQARSCYFVQRRPRPKLMDRRTRPLPLMLTRARRVPMDSLSPDLDRVNRIGPALKVLRPKMLMSARYAVRRDLPGSTRGRDPHPSSMQPFCLC